MTRTTYKRVPFNLELAKKITNKEVKGRIVTRDGRKIRIICTDRKDKSDVIAQYSVIALVTEKDGHECEYEYLNTGRFSAVIEETDLDLHIEVPTYYRDYSNFVPQRWQPCLVRDTSSDLWRAEVCCGTDSYGVPIFYSANNSDGCCHWGHFLPISKVTERLFGTKKSYEQLIQELDENGKD
jgi:hypothetical protein